ncbi:MAG: hypothetical protein ACHQ1G_00185 [Planctomycetota bacterium]|jgi:hypothetical protein
MPEIELSEEAKDAMGHLDGSNVAEAREIGKGTKAPPFDPGKPVRRAAPPVALPRCAIDGCGNPVPPRTKSGGKPKLYCSTTCAARARQQRGRKNWHGKWKHRRNGTAPKADPLSLRMKIGDLAFEGDGEAADVRKGSAVFFDTVKRRAAAYAEYVRWLNDGKRVAKLFEEAGGVPPELDALLPR